MADYERMINGCRFILKWVYAYIYPSSAIINKKAGVAGVGTFRNRWGERPAATRYNVTHLNWARKESLILALETTTLTLSTL